MLLFPKKTLNDKEFLEYENRLKKGELIRAYHTKSEVETYAIPKGTLSQPITTLALGKKPMRMYLLFQEQSRFQGKMVKKLRNMGEESGTKT